MAEDNINTETGESMGGRSPRFTYWAAFLAFSLITLIASVEEKNQTDVADDKNQKWAVACSAVTFAVTFLAVAMQLHPVANSLFSGTRAEGVVIIVLVAFWSATVALVSDARHGLAVDSEGSVVNGNLYYFSWAGFVTSIMLCVSYLREVFHVDVAGEMKNRGARLTLWSAMLAAALIVLGACANIFDQDCKPQVESDTYCRRTKYGIALGATGTAFSVAIVGMKLATGTSPFVVESVISILLVIMNAFGVAFLTSTKGPGAPLGNLYYFSWISVLCAGMLVANCLEEYKSGGAVAAEASNNEGEIQVETLDETI